MRTAFALTIALLIAGPRGAAQDPAAAALLKAGTDYLDTYVRQASGASLDERYTLTQVSGGSMGTPLRIGSEVVFINVNGRLYGFRDAATVDGAKLRDPSVPRIVPLLAEPTQAKWEQAQTFAAAGQKYFASELIVLLDDPVLALHFIQAPNQGKFTYRLDGKKKMNGVETTALRFEETRGERTKYVMGSRGNGYVTGRLWIDPATGAVHQSELWLESTTESARVNITYAFHKDLNLWLPAKMGANYDMRPAPDNQINRGEGGYGARMTYQANADYSKPRHTPIDLTKMTR